MVVIEYYCEAILGDGNLQQTHVTEMTATLLGAGSVWTGLAAEPGLLEGYTTTKQFDVAVTGTDNRVRSLSQTISSESSKWFSYPNGEAEYIYSKSESSAGAQARGDEVVQWENTALTKRNSKLTDDKLASYEESFDYRNKYTDSNGDHTVEGSVGYTQDTEFGTFTEKQLADGEVRFDSSYSVPISKEEAPSEGVEGSKSSPGKDSDVDTEKGEEEEKSSPADMSAEPAEGEELPSEPTELAPADDAAYSGIEASEGPSD